MLTFIQLREEHLEQVLKWRTQPDVTKYMFTDLQYDLDNQYKWFQKIKQSDKEKYWIISYEETLVGLISLNDVDDQNKKTSWGYYIGEQNYRMLGGIIPPYLYNYVFYKLNMHKITAEVMEGNVNVMKLHFMHGYREVGHYKDHIYKYNTYHDVYVYELLKDQWDELAPKYKKYVMEFE